MSLRATLHPNKDTLYTQQLISTVADGTPPLVVTSGTLVPRLFAERALFADGIGANILSGPITANAGMSHITSQTGLGNTFVMNTNPVIINPDIGNATANVLTLNNQLISTVANGTAPFTVLSSTLVANLHAQTAETANTVTTIPNLTGPVLSTGVATRFANKTGSGNVVVTQSMPSISNPTISTAVLTGTTTTAAQQVSGVITSTVVTGTAPLSIASQSFVDNLYVWKAKYIDGNISGNQALTGNLSVAGWASFGSNVSIEGPLTINSSALVANLFAQTSNTTESLESATTTINVGNATAPTTGQVLTAVDSTHATWQTPTGGGGGITNVVAGNVTGETTAASGGSTILELSSNVLQVFTGSTDHTVVLPESIRLGTMFVICNKISSGNLTVSNIGGSQVDFYNTQGSGTYFCAGTANVLSSWIKASSGSG